ncbi:hypothetical protein J4216_04985 [Candidatus Woesearchaeota archaeon]|nr:hypothetical protein [Candidatus Woesearchaeota archaeon]
MYKTTDYGVGGSDYGQKFYPTFKEDIPLLNSNTLVESSIDSRFSRRWFDAKVLEGIVVFDNPDERKQYVDDKLNKLFRELGINNDKDN